MNPEAHSHVYNNENLPQVYIGLLGIRCTIAVLFLIIITCRLVIKSTIFVNYQIAWAMRNLKHTKKLYTLIIQMQYNNNDDIIMQYFSRQDPIATRLPIFLLILILLVFFLVSFYYFHDWKWGKQTAIISLV
jgi:hypothetical protein